MSMSDNDMGYFAISVICVVLGYFAIMSKIDKGIGKIKRILFFWR